MTALGDDAKVPKKLFMAVPLYGKRVGRGIKYVPYVCAKRRRTGNKCRGLRATGLIIPKAQGLAECSTQCQWTSLQPSSSLAPRTSNPRSGPRTSPDRVCGATADP